MGPQTLTVSRNKELPPMSRSHTAYDFLALIVNKLMKEFLPYAHKFK